MSVRRSATELRARRATAGLRFSAAAAVAAVALYALSVTGCADKLVEEPKGFTTIETFYQTGADLNSATIAIYSAMRGLQDEETWAAAELASDAGRADNREPNASTYAPDRLAWDATASDKYWTTLYSMISRANLVLANGPAIATQNQQMQAVNLGEARLLRGYAYFLLTKAYDDVPLLLTPGEQANLRPTRTRADSVQRAAISDLTLAEAALPARWSATDGYGIPTQGRPGKSAAQMALADLYLWRSSFMKTNEWQLAASWAKRGFAARQSR